MKKKLWIGLFIRIAVIFLGFVLMITLANSTLLVHYFTYKQEHLLAEKSLLVAEVDPDDTEDLEDVVWPLREEFNFDIEIYEENGRLIYSTVGPKMWGFPERDDHKLINDIMEVEKSKILSDGAQIATVRSAITGDEYLVCRRFDDGIITELRTQTSLLRNSASVAGEFIVIIALICFAASVVWIFLFARKFSDPIVQMSEITGNMSELDFSRKVEVSRADEIGQLGSSINNLSDRLDGALQELRETNAKLRTEIELERQLDGMRRGFVANVSHELKTPLAIISGYAEGLKLNINSQSREEYCNTIIDEAGRMNRLVLSILELSKYESAQMPTNPEEFDISAVAEDMLARIFIGRTEVETICDIEKDTLVFADPLQTEQILKSFLENAAVHVNEGGLVKIFAEKEEGKLRISVFNSGSSIDPEYMPHIWQSFFRGNKAHSRSEGRFGLGLSIVSAIIKAQNETCGVYNTEDGVCFWFTCKIAKYDVD